MHTLDYNHLYNFFIVGQSGSLKAAAINLSLSQSTLSEQMKTLEDFFHRKLFSRAGRSLSLTQDGRTLFSKIESLFEKANDLCISFDQKLWNTNKMIEIGIATSISKILSFKILRPLFQKSGISVRITESPCDILLSAFRKQEIDFFITHEKLSKSFIKNLKSIPLEKPELLVIGAGRFADLKMSSPTEFNQQPFILFTRDSQLRWETERFFKYKNINPDVKIEVDDANLIKTAVLNEAGIAIIPDYCIDKELQEGKVTVLGSLPSSELSIYAHYVERAPTDEFSSVLKTLSKSKAIN